ncbi:MAG: arsenate reductase (azurin) large subunit [Confluentimicrobium sp.]|uniref:arsenate reductase (azurin) large subunit n=1 Tax=Actibacterium sp. TaxID=1872125 RepID=UPI000C354AF9|nr:arsenate reductase (azurin) large subunit [Actibacterium sp.]MBC58352.1 arsenate reductase (azurin) large subunit [Actibacterium sp.]MDY6858635.1 arsenate reductase (azurin) large subunit [Pseudomonadota bacterium]|tara:strand:- start:1495 stop:4170 length:2676 start_codon:yes stop_codon:yes gene_type:complete
MSTPYYVPEETVPLPPPDADVISTACDYCIVACGYKVYRWPVRGGHQGGPLADQNAFGEDFPVNPLGPWIAPNQHNIVLHNGEPHHVVIIPDKDTEFVNYTGNSSIRGGAIAQKVYNPQTPTRDRLKSPMVRMFGVLMPVTWDFALDIAAEVGNHVLEKHGTNAYNVKTFSYGYMENTYAITKYALRHVRTANFTFHDTPSDVTSTPGFRDAGFDNFGPSYDDWAEADTLLICGTDPYETKTILFTDFIMPAIQGGQKAIFMVPRRTTGVAFAEKNGGLLLDIQPGTDLPVVLAIARVIVENGWQDDAWIRDWVNSKWESSSGFGQGTRNTPWQWRTTWGMFQTDGFEDWKEWLLAQDYAVPEKAAEIAQIDVQKIYTAAEWMAKPKADGTRPKTSVMIEKGFYWSNNTGNTNAISALGIIVGAGGRPGQVIGRAGGHQRGGLRGGGYPRNKSPEKLPGRRRRAMDTDRYLMGGHTRLAHVIGTTWVQAMCGSQSLQAKFDELTTRNPHQVTSFDKKDIIDTLKRRADSGGMVVWNQDIYLVDPIGARYADIVFPASGWGEETFTRANGERRLRLYPKFYDAPGEAKPDWWIIAQLARKMGFEGFDWQTSNDVLEEGARHSRGSRKDFNMVLVAARREGKTLHEKLGEFGTNGIQGPVMMLEDGSLQGTKRLHDTTRKLPETGPSGANVFNKKLTHFNTQTGKCNLQKAPWGLFSSYWEWLKPREGEIWITSGRINERWQSGYDDRRRPYIVQRWPENWIELHPGFAEAHGIESGDYVQVYSDRIPVQTDTIVGVEGDDFDFAKLLKNGHIELTRASITAVAIVTPAVKENMGYMDFLHTAQPANALSGRVVDWISGNYNYKMGVGQVRRMGESPYKKQFRSMSFARRDIA